MLSSSMVREEVEVILDLVGQSEIDEAKRRLSKLSPEVSSEYGKGAVLALNGIIHVIDNKNVERMADREKLGRAAERLPKSQMIDDMDKGYLQAIAKWAKKKPASPQAKAPAPAKA